MALGMEVMSEEEVVQLELLQAQGRCYSDYPPWRGFITYHHPTTGSVQLEAECQTEKVGEL